jgi:hypothetical protein
MIEKMTEKEKLLRTAADFSDSQAFTEFAELLVAYFSDAGKVSAARKNCVQKLKQDPLHNMNISSRVYFELQGVNPDSMNNSLRSKYFFAGSSFGEGLKLLKVCSDDLKLVEIMPVSPSQRDIEKKMKVLDGVSRALIKGFLSGMEMFVPECFLQRYITLDVVNVSRYRQVIQAFMYNQKLQSNSNATLEMLMRSICSSTQVT